MGAADPPRVEGFLTLGRIVGVFGVRGWVKVQSFTDPPEALLMTPEWTLLDARGERAEAEVTEASMHREQLRVALDTVADRNAAERLVGTWVLVPREAVAPPGEREHFRDDLVGFEVRNLEEAELGTLSHFVDLPAGAVMVVRGRGEHWIPAVPTYLRRVDRQARRLTVDWPEEL